MKASELKSLKDDAMELLIKSVKQGTVDERSSIPIINSINRATAANIKHIISGLRQSAYAGVKMSSRKIKAMRKNDRENVKMLNQIATSGKRVSVDYTIWIAFLQSNHVREIDVDG